MFAAVFGWRRLAICEASVYFVGILLTGIRLCSLGLPIFTVMQRVSWAVVLFATIFLYLIVARQLSPRMPLSLILVLGRHIQEVAHGGADGKEPVDNVFGGVKVAAGGIFAAVAVPALAIANMLNEHVVLGRPAELGFDKLLFETFGAGFPFVIMTFYILLFLGISSTFYVALVVLRVSRYLSLAYTIQSVDSLSAASRERRRTVCESTPPGTELSRPSVAESLLFALDSTLNEGSTSSSLLSARWETVSGLLNETFNNMRLPILLVNVVVIVNLLITLGSYVLLSKDPLLSAFLPGIVFIGTQLYLLAFAFFSFGRMQFNLDAATELHNRNREEDFQGVHDVPDVPQGYAGLLPSAEASPSMLQMVEGFVAKATSAGTNVDRRLPGRRLMERALPVYFGMLAVAILFGLCISAINIFIVFAYQCVSVTGDANTGNTIEAFRSSCSVGGKALFIAIRALLDSSATVGLPLIFLFICRFWSPKTCQVSLTRSKVGVLSLCFLLTILLSISIRLFFIDKWYRSFVLYPLVGISISTCLSSIGPRHWRTSRLGPLFVIGCLPLVSVALLGGLLIPRFIVADSVGQQLFISLVLVPSVMLLCRTGIDVADAKLSRRLSGFPNSPNFEFSFLVSVFGSVSSRIFFASVTSFMEQIFVAAFLVIVELTSFGVYLFRTSVIVRQTSTLGFVIIARPNWFAFRKFVLLLSVQMLGEISSVVIAQGFVLTVSFFRFGTVPAQPFYVGILFVTAEAFVAGIAMLLAVNVGVAPVALWKLYTKAANVVALTVLGTYAYLTSSFQIIAAGYASQL